VWKKVCTIILNKIRYLFCIGCRQKMSSRGEKLSQNLQNSQEFHKACLALVLNFCNHCKNIWLHKLPQQPFWNVHQTFYRSPLIKFPNLITLLISFSFNQTIIFLYKYSCLFFNKSVFNWTFCLLLYSQKHPIVRNLHNCSFPEIYFNPFSKIFPGPEGWRREEAPGGHREEEGERCYSGVRAIKLYFRHWRNSRTS